MFVTLDEVIATASTLIKDVTTTDKLLFRQWIGMMALPELGISEDDVKIVTLYPVDFAAQKPSDMRALIDLNLFDCNGCQLPHKYRTGGKRIFRDNRIPRTAVVTTESENIANAIPVDISDDNWAFHLGTNGDKVGAIVVRYWAFPTDDVGQPMIRQTDMLACAYFCVFMHSVREKRPRNEIEQNRIYWATESDRCRARKKMYSLSPDKMQTIIKSTWMRGIPNFDFRQF